MHHVPFLEEALRNLQQVFRRGLAWGSATRMLGRKRDIVEEFWDERTLKLCSKNAREIAPQLFLNQLRAFLGASGKMWPTRSGSGALRQFLQSIVSAEKRDVLICSLNCPAVADAVISAGFRVDTFDLADTTGRVDWQIVADQLRPRHKALVVPHLFGAPTDFRPLLETARKSGVILIEDCAHTLGGRIGDFTAGTLADAAIFSFNYDKPISLGGGGILLVNNPSLWSKIRHETLPVSLEKEHRELNQFLKYLRRRRQDNNQARLLKKSLRPVIRGITLGAYGHKLFPVSGIGPLRAALGIEQLNRYPEILKRRNANAGLFADATRQSWYVGPDARPAWLKQKVVPADVEEGARISRSLRLQGLPVGTFNWSITIDQHLGLPVKPNAEYVAKHGLDIPIHQNMERIELETICRAFGGEFVT